MLLPNREIKEISSSNGFELCSITKIHNISEQQKHIDKWLLSNYNGNMDWFETNNEIRLNPQLLVPNAKSIIICAKFYNPKPDFNTFPKIAKYALGVDYHYTIKHYLTKILDNLKTISPNLNGEVYCDSAPILERYWAKKSGIGWIGKNGLITTTKYGSMINLGFIIIDQELDQYDTETEDRCGNCEACLKACPTGAIKGSTMDARKCISYLTIEHEGEFSIEQSELLATKSDNSIFGCDICIDACPWNKKAIRDNEITHQIDDKFVNDVEYWQNISSHKFNKLYRITPLQRVKVKGIKRNIQAITGIKQ